MGTGWGEGVTGKVMGSDQQDLLQPPSSHSTPSAHLLLLVSVNIVPDIVPSPCYPATLPEQAGGFLHSVHLLIRSLVDSVGGPGVPVSLAVPFSIPWIILSLFIQQNPTQPPNPVLHLTFLMRSFLTSIGRI